MGVSRLEQPNPRPSRISTRVSGYRQPEFDNQPPPCFWVRGHPRGTAGHPPGIVFLGTARIPSPPFRLDLEARIPRHLQRRPHCLAHLGAASSHAAAPNGPTFVFSGTGWTPGRRPAPVPESTSTTAPTRNRCPQRPWRASLDHDGLDPRFPIVFSGTARVPARPPPVVFHGTGWPPSPQTEPTLWLCGAAPRPPGAVFATSCFRVQPPALALLGIRIALRMPERQPESRVKAPGHPTCVGSCFRVQRWRPGPGSCFRVHPEGWTRRASKSERRLTPQGEVGAALSAPLGWGEGERLPIRVFGYRTSPGPSGVRPEAHGHDPPSNPGDLV